MPKDKRLSDMLDNLIDNNAEQAEVNFHDYLQDKIQNTLNPGSEEDAVPVQPEETTNEE